VTPVPARSPSARRISRISAGSSPFVGSSSSSISGAPIMACAIPRRCRIPCEYVFTLRRTSSPSPASASAGPRDGAGQRARPARQYSSRFRIPDTCGMNAGRSIIAPTRASTASPGVTRRPSRDVAPRLGRTSPSIIRSVVVLPAPLGPSRPTTRPGSTEKDSASTASTAERR
jgi:hypothetical protein